MILRTARNLYERLMSVPPQGIIYGHSVRIQRPHRISNPNHIRIGERTEIRYGAMIEPILEYAGASYHPTIEIGSDVYIGPNVYMACIGSMTIGDGVVMSEYVYLNDATHGFDPEAGLIMKQKLVSSGPISIGNHCFLGMRSAILPGVTLGDHCIVAINSVVNKSFPAFSMVAGSPARLVKRYSPEQKRWIRVDSSKEPRV